MKLYYLTNIKNITPGTAYSAALEFVRGHYENFPVISFLIKKELRKHVAVVYWFARTADDIADEGNYSPDERLERLNNFEERLTALLNKNYETEYELALYLTINEFNLSHESFYKLLAAFRQDILQNRWSRFEDILSYCSNSADPVGRIILELHGIRSKEAFFYSDQICTALQLTNFYQDVSRDLQKNRIYFPIEDMKRFGVSEKSFENKENSDKLKELIKFSVLRAEGFFEEGEKLLAFLPGRLRIEIKWTLLGGKEVLHKIKNIDYDVLNVRPALSKFDFLLLFYKSLVT